jgi:hypothetical protein
VEAIEKSGWTSKGAFGRKEVLDTQEKMNIYGGSYVAWTQAYMSNKGQCLNIKLSMVHRRPHAYSGLHYPELRFAEVIAQF